MKIVIETSDEGLVQGLAVALLVHKRRPCSIKIKLDFADDEAGLAEPLIRASLVGGAGEPGQERDGEIDEAAAWLAGLDSKAGG